MHMYIFKEGGDIVDLAIHGEPDITSLLVLLHLLLGEKLRFHSNNPGPKGPTGTLPA